MSSLVALKYFLLIKKFVEDIILLIDKILNQVLFFKNDFTEQQETIKINENFDGNINLSDKSMEKLSSGYVELLIRKSKNSSSSTISVQIYQTGLIKVYIGNKLSQEANLQASKKFDFNITDTGEDKDIYIDLNSYDSSSSKFSLQLVTKSQYSVDQEFYVGLSLISENDAVGINSLKVSNDLQN